jgi:hypothetical protein
VKGANVESMIGHGLLILELQRRQREMYEGKSVNRSQIDIKVKHVIFEPGNNLYFSI